MELLTIENVAAALRVSAKTVRRHVADGSLPYVCGAGSNRLYFRRQDVRALLTGHGGAGQPT